MIRKLTIAAALTSAMIAAAPAAHAGPDEYLGEIITVGFNFCPRGTMEADGRLLPINENTALFSLLGTMYGGDGRTTFALPDLRGRTIIGAGQGPGLPDYRIGEKGTAGTVPNNGKNGAPGARPASGDPLPYIALKQCVVAQGIYPSRN
jgi:microcystin-dependent protein|nr:tail fiber protein [uncultured Hyphomonas sp.]